MTVEQEKFFETKQVFYKKIIFKFSYNFQIKKGFKNSN